MFSNTAESDNDLPSSWRKSLDIHPGMVFISREISGRDKKVSMLLHKASSGILGKLLFPVLRNGAFELGQVRGRVTGMG